eukprot:CAMPEP_0178673474 /NCGR_PEP_ID=MMETSP0698-20121128/34324_1 /TAXON_ID=265572 /ORGANISM="Extubocellulus spinifer, Strain CCMP396" /LENGTH=425 /DNA_ID=CAMNT_0020317493 /DNA_START=14 /DNA_END=1288 /DNA_ORIENTATION=-
MTILRRTTGDDCTFTALPVRALLLQVLFILLVHVPTTAAGSYSGGRSFLLRMFWTDGYEWQSSTSEKYWCATCSSDYCDEYDTIEVQKCDADDAAQQWQYVEVSGSKNRGLIKTMGRDLCIQAHSTNGRNFHLRQCDDENSDQILRGFEYGGSKFELTTKNDDDDRCITQHHHPRIGEELRMQECERARKTKTSYWVTYKESRGGRPSLASYGRDGCDDDYPCDKCTGDCDDNSNCMGNLKCFQRSGRQDVPGCSGDGVSGDDYCYDPADDDDDDNDDDEEGGDVGNNNERRTQKKRTFLNDNSDIVDDDDYVAAADDDAAVGIGNIGNGETHDNEGPTDDNEEDSDNDIQKKKEEYLQQKVEEDIVREDDGSNDGSSNNHVPLRPTKAMVPLTASEVVHDDSLAEVPPLLPLELYGLADETRST